MESWRNELYHYGIKGMKWGVRRTPEQLGHARLRKARAVNLEKWGQTEDANVLYVTGLSGSGKSTVSEYLKDGNTSVIHLDLFFETDIDRPQRDDRAYLDKRFTSYLKEHMQFYRAVGDKTIPKKDRGKYYDEFASVIENFGREEYRKGRRVVAEGIQVANGTLYEDSASSLRSKPVIFLTTSPVESFRKAGEREGRPAHLIPQLLSYDAPIELITWYLQGAREYRQIAKSLGATKLYEIDIDRAKERTSKLLNNMAGMKLNG